MPRKAFYFVCSYRPALCRECMFNCNMDFVSAELTNKIINIFTMKCALSFVPSAAKWCHNVLAWINVLQCVVRRGSRQEVCRELTWAAFRPGLGKHIVTSLSRTRSKGQRALFGYNLCPGQFHCPFTKTTCKVALRRFCELPKLFKKQNFFQTAFANSCKPQ